VDEIEKANLVLKNIKNILTDLGDANVQIELLANSEGIYMLTRPAAQFEKAIEELTSRKVAFAACSNTMKELGFTKESLLDPVVIVPSGVGELVRKQSEGYFYIKP
jgi:intracellular sulfur oxidation DsrE/DsrF family protein